jgi:hypothetical protein
VLGTFVLVVVLHSLWNIVNGLEVQNAAQLAVTIAGNLVIAGISLTLLIRRLRESRRNVQ